MGKRRFTCTENLKREEERERIGELRDDGDDAVVACASQKGRVLRASDTRTSKVSRTNAFARRDRKVRATTRETTHDHPCRIHIHPRPPR